MRSSFLHTLPALFFMLSRALSLSVQLGPEKILAYPSPGPYQCPDAALSVQTDAAGQRLMFWSDGSTYRVVGSGLFPNNAPSPLTPVLSSGVKGSYDANGNWLLASFYVGSKLVAFTHVENHGFDCPGSYAEWNAGAVLSSFDDGITWHRDGLAIHDAQPCVPTFGGSGYSSVLPRRDGPGFIAWGGCTAFRTDDAQGAPGTWKRYLGGSFSSPGINGSSTCLPGMPANACCPIVSFNTYVGQYIAIISTWGSNNTFLIATSPDGIAWSSPEVLLEVPHPRAIAYGQLIGDSNSSVSGRSATLLYAAAPPTSGKPRDFVYRSITFGP